ncbi:MAG: hypothetical protein WC942_04585 [Clostridia bacterium]|jgi:hypothetical protein
MIVLTRFIARMVARLIPKTETYPTFPEHFVGSVGKVTLTVSEHQGQIHAYDLQGSLHILDARPYGNNSYSIGSRVLIITYNPETNTYLVDKEPLESI